MIATAGCLSLLFTAFAYFDDTEASTENSFEVGVWDIEVEGGGNHTFSNLTAGASGTETWVVTNTGSVPAYVVLNIAVIEEGTGDLGEFLMGYLHISGGGDIYGPDAIKDMGGSYDINLPLEAGQSGNIILDWNVSDGYEPYDENDRVRLLTSFDVNPAP